MRGDEFGNLGFMGVADDKRDTGERSEFFGSALRIAARDQDFCRRILRVYFADGVAGLGVGGGSDRAGVDDDEFGFFRRR